MTYHAIVSEMIVKPIKEPLFSEMATRVSAVDEAAGEFVKVSQQGRADVGSVFIDPTEWQELKRVIDAFFADIEKRGQ
jgi:hypothetical protein